MENSKTIYTGKNFEYIEIKGGVANFGDTHKVPPQLTSKLGKSTIIGRKKELEEIDKLLKENGSLLLINGIGGIGKSTIASYYLYSQKKNYNYYGFFEGLESFTNELKPRLNLKSEKPNELFWEALAKLGTLDGKKLLVLDDVKDIEENQAYIDKILELKHSGYKILITSREEIENIKLYNLNVLSLDDAKAFFNSIYKIEDEALLEEILEYLDYHAFFIEKTAHSIKKTLTPHMIRDKFKNGEFSKISVKRKQNFNKFLNQLFRLDSLDSEEILMLKQLSALPSIEIPFEFLENIFKETEKEKNKFNWDFLKFWQKKYTHPNIEELLDFLSEKGWLTKLERGYKLHQIIKEYLLANHMPSFEEMEVVVDSFNILIENSSDVQVAVDNRENIIYFEDLIDLFDRLMIEKEKVGTFFNEFGLIYYHLGLDEKAVHLCLKALEIRKNILGEEHLDTVTSYNDLVVLYESMGEYQKAEYICIKALNIRKKILGEEHLDIAQSYNNLGSLCIGEYQKAEPLYIKALKINENILGEEHPNTTANYNNLASLYKDRGKYKKAEPLYLKDLKINEKILGEEHPDTATSYNNLAVLYFKMDEYQKSESLYLKALEIRKKVLGKEHPSIATSYNNLALLYDRMGKYQKVEPLSLKALKIKVKLLGEEHPSIATSYNNLGGFYYEGGEFNKAYRFMKKAVEIRSKILPFNHPDLINSKEGLEMIKKELTKSQNNQKGN